MRKKAVLPRPGQSRQCRLEQKISYNMFFPPTHNDQENKLLLQRKVLKEIVLSQEF